VVSLAAGVLVLSFGPISEARAQGSSLLDATIGAATEIRNAATIIVVNTRKIWNLTAQTGAPGKSDAEIIALYNEVRAEQAKIVDPLNRIERIYDQVEQNDDAPRTVHYWIGHAR